VIPQNENIQAGVKSCVKKMSTPARKNLPVVSRIDRFLAFQNSAPALALALAETARRCFRGGGLEGRAYLCEARGCALSSTRSGLRGEQRPRRNVQRRRQCDGHAAVGRGHAPLAKRPAAERAESAAGHRACGVGGHVRAAPCQPNASHHRLSGGAVGDMAPPPPQLRRWSFGAGGGGGPCRAGVHRLESLAFQAAARSVRGVDTLLGGGRRR